MTDFFHGPAPVLPSPIEGPDFNAPVDALPSPEFKTFDSLTNVEFADDPLTNFQANANEFTGGDGFDMVGLPNGGLMSAEPITEIMEFSLGQAITFEESGMDGLVAAGPFDTAALNEPQNNNNVF